MLQFAVHWLHQHNKWYKPEPWNDPHLRQQTSLSSLSTEHRSEPSAERVPMPDVLPASTQIIPAWRATLFTGPDSSTGQLHQGPGDSSYQQLRSEFLVVFLTDHCVTMLFLIFSLPWHDWWGQWKMTKWDIAAAAGISSTQEMVSGGSWSSGFDVVQRCECVCKMKEASAFRNKSLRWHRNTECLGLAGTLEDHLVQCPCSSRTS